MASTTLVRVNQGTYENPSLFAILLDMLSTVLIIWTSCSLVFFSCSSIHCWVLVLSTPSTSCSSSSCKSFWTWFKNPNGPSNYPMKASMVSFSSISCLRVTSHLLRYSEKYWTFENTHWSMSLILPNWPLLPFLSSSSNQRSCFIWSARVSLLSVLAKRRSLREMKHYPSKSSFPKVSLS